MARKSFAEHFPELAREWHPTMNTALSPEQVSPGSSKSAWWLGPCGHEWSASVNRRAKGAGCPYCAGKATLPGFNDLATAAPEAAKDWDWEHNGDLRPDTISRSSKKRVWWIGEQCGHRWEGAVLNRASGRGCPYCSGNKVLKGVNDLGTLAPGTSADWDHESNGGITPSEVHLHSNQPYWWQGAKCGHRWQTTPAHRARGQACPYCSGRRVLAGFNDLATLRPEVAASWHPTKNGDLTPADVTVSVGSKAWWICEFSHEWQSVIANRSKGVGCPACDGKLTVRGETDLLTMRPDVAAEWDYEKNTHLRPEEVNPYSGKNVWWVGNECGHSWRSPVAFRSGVSLKCPYCIGKRVLPGFNDLSTTFPEVARQWDSAMNRDLQPTEVTAGSNKSIWWRCEKGHQWRAAPATRSRGVGCPYCGGFFVISGENDLETLNPVLAAQWHPTKNDGLTPRAVKVKSNKRVWWVCEEGHEWRVSISDRSQYETGCPFCSHRQPWSKAEKEVFAYVVTTFDELTVHENYRAQRLGRFELDIYVENIRLGIEFNGEYWHDESRDPRIKDRHKRKQSICAAHGVRLAIVWEKDWTQRPEEVKEKIVGIIAGGEIPAWMTYARQ